MLRDRVSTKDGEAATVETPRAPVPFAVCADIYVTANVLATKSVAHKWEMETHGGIFLWVN